MSTTTLPAALPFTAMRALSLPEIQTGVLSFLSPTDLVSAACVSSEWFSAACPYLYSYLDAISATRANGRDKAMFRYPILALTSTPPSALPAVEWARGHAIDAVRVVTLQKHGHTLCGDFVFPTSLETPGKERPINVLHYEWAPGNYAGIECSLAECFNPSKLVLYGISLLSTMSSMELPCIHARDSRTRKIVFLLDPPEEPPNTSMVALYRDLPVQITDVVVHLRSGAHRAGQTYRGIMVPQGWGPELASYMRMDGHGPDKLAGHLANMLVQLRGQGRRFTFVGCEQMDLGWVTTALPSNGYIGAEDRDNETRVRNAVGQLVQREVQRRLDKLGVERGTQEVEGYISVRFVSVEQYKAENDCEGEMLD